MTQTSRRNLLATLTSFATTIAAVPVARGLAAPKKKLHLVIAHRREED
jgi:hypothetical protein